MTTTLYKVTATSGLNIRAQASSSSAILSTIPLGTQLKSDSESNGWAHVTYNGISGYAPTVYLGKISTTESQTEANKNGTTSPSGANTASAASPTTYSPSTSNAESQKLFQRYLRSFGCPPLFSKWVDLYYYDALGPGVGRRMAESFFVNPSILSLCPGTVDYLPGFSSKEKDQFLNAVKAMANGVNLGETGDNLSGKLYEFKSAYTAYMNTVNLLCRATSVYLGIGDTKMPGSNTSLKNFDYGYWTTPEAASGSVDKSIFQETKRVLSTIVTDNSYIHFFITHQGTSVNESIDTSTTSSELENLFNNSNLHGISRNLQFMLGGSIDGTALDSDIERALNQASNSSDFVKKFGQIAKNYLSGGRLIFPQMIDNVGYSKTLSATVKFVSPYGDKLSVFLRCFVPILHLLAFTLPKQLSDNMYTYPYLVRVFQQGFCNFDLAIISSLRLTKGGNDITSWTIDMLPTEIEASFDITPLYSSLMSSSTTQPFLFMKNTALAEYLATMCGVDMKANAISTKIELAKTALEGKLKDIPTNLARSIMDSKLVNGLQKFAQIIN